MTEQTDDSEIAKFLAEAIETADEVETSIANDRFSFSTLVATDDDTAE